MAGAAAPRPAELEKALEDSIEVMRQLGIKLENHLVQNEAVYFDQLNDLTEHLRRVYAARDAVTGSVPLAVIKDYLDKGLDPDLYAKHRLEHAESLNQQSKGRVDALKLLRDELRSEVDRRGLGKERKDERGAVKTEPGKGGEGGGKRKRDDD